MGKRVIEEPIHLNQNTAGMSTADASGAVETDIVTYTVPDNSEIIFKHTDWVGLYLEDNETTPAELATGTYVRIVQEDPQGRREQTIIEGQYDVFKEFQQANLKAYVGKRQVIPANFNIVIKVTPAASVDVSDCRWTLTCTLVYETVD